MNDGSLDDVRCGTMTKVVENETARPMPRDRALIDWAESGTHRINRLLTPISDFCRRARGVILSPADIMCSNQPYVGYRQNDPGGRTGVASTINKKGSRKPVDLAEIRSADHESCGPWGAAPFPSSASAHGGTESYQRVRITRHGPR